MPTDSLLTAAEFAERKFDFPEGGRWTELVAGRLVHLEPPDDAHGNFVRTMSAALGRYAHASGQGYACFELGLIVRRSPDTVRCPPICYFKTGERFAEQENVVTETRPALVVEIASSNDRRREMTARVTGYLEWGVPLVWVADPPAQQIVAFEPGRGQQQVAEWQTLFGGSVLDGFSCPVAELFADPAWWKAPPRPQT